MAISWNEIRSRAAAFVLEWQDETREHAEAKSFWDAFFKVFGVSRRRVASFETFVHKLGGNQGFIDLFWPGVMLAEHKSRGKDLDKAHAQALDYFPGLTDAELPRYIVVSDFSRFRLYDLDDDETHEFHLVDLLDHIEKFGFIAGYEQRTYSEQDPVNAAAAEKMAILHDSLYQAGYRGHDLKVLLVRLLFCLFADDTGIFMPRDSFQEFLLHKTREDGSDLGAQLNALFEVMNTPVDERQRHLDEQIAAFPFVNGRLFQERLRTPHFDSTLREALLDAGWLDWAPISPAIFGAMFQSVMNAEERRNLGAHYTSEKDILKTIGPLFLDDLYDEFNRARRNPTKLREFHQKLASIKLLDPACGCGNFLVIAYRELRLLEIEVLKEIQQGQQVISINDLVLVDVDQCYGIEIEEFPAQIAQVALWLMDHQMNLTIAKTFGEYFVRLPLESSAHIIHGNALTLDWKTCFGDAQPDQFHFILGNPPFVGKQYQTTEQKADMKVVMRGIRGSGVLDYVTAWYIRAAQYMEANPQTATAFVSTNSISQGEQVGVLWDPLFERYGAKIHFAHRTFQWTSEATGVAAVHVVIIGFALFDKHGRKQLFEYEDLRGEPHEVRVSNINPYLVEGPDIAVTKRRQPISDGIPNIFFGSMPNDGGNLLLSSEDRQELLESEPGAAPYILRFMGSREFLNGIDRYCLWLDGIAPHILRNLPHIMKRVEAVRLQRSESSRAATRQLAQTPTLFGENRQPNTNYLLIPGVSSENRPIIPIGFNPPNIIASNLAHIVPNATLYHFGVLSSSMHMAWTRYTAGRLKSDYRYSNQIVYNNFPWPHSPSDKAQKRVEKAAQAVLDARQSYLDQGSTLADLYDPNVMPSPLVKAHRALDRAVDLAYRPQPFTTEMNRVSFLFERYAVLAPVELMIDS